MTAPEGEEDRPAARAAQPPPATSPQPQPSAHGDAIREIPETVRATVGRIDALQHAPGPHHETAEALAREAHTHGAHATLVSGYDERCESVRRALADCRKILDDPDTFGRHLDRRPGAADEMKRLSARIESDLEADDAEIRRRRRQERQQQQERRKEEQEKQERRKETTRDRGGGISM